MKTFFTIVIIVILAVIVLFTYTNGCSTGQNMVTEDLFNRKTDTIENKIDSIAFKQKIMQKKIDSIMQVLEDVQNTTHQINYSVDTLKAGQILIYSEVTKNINIEQSKLNWAGKLYKYLTE